MKDNMDSQSFLVSGYCRVWSSTVVCVEKRTKLPGFHSTVLKVILTIFRGTLN